MIFRPRQLKRKKLFLIILTAILLILVTGFLGYKVFTENKITKFQIESSNVNCTGSEEITKYLQTFNINYFYFKADKLEADLKKKFFCIGKVQSVVTYPDKLKLNIVGREAKFVVKTIKPSAEINPTIELNLDQLNATQSTTEAYPPKVLNQILTTYKSASDSAMYLVDGEGVIFQETGEDVSFPRLSIFSQELRVGETISDNMIPKVSDISAKLKELDQSTDNLIVVGDKLIIDSKPRITFSLNRPLDRQAASLQLILAQAKMNLDPDNRDSKSIAPATDSPIDSIDLRFDRPVVVYGKR